LNCASCQSKAAALAATGTPTQKQHGSQAGKSCNNSIITGSCDPLTSAVDTYARHGAALSLALLQPITAAAAAGGPHLACICAHALLRQQCHNTAQLNSGAHKRAGQLSQQLAVRRCGWLLDEGICEEGVHDDVCDFGKGFVKVGAPGFWMGSRWVRQGAGRHQEVSCDACEKLLVLCI
jgi:hypothetical protein